MVFVASTAGIKNRLQLKLQMLDQGAGNKAKEIGGRLWYTEPKLKTQLHSNI